MNWVIKFLKNVIISIAFVFIIAPISLADDIEIFESEAPIEAPNILFVMDVSGSMGWEVGSTDIPADNTKTRLSILKRALADLLNDTEMNDVNVGLMSFSGHSGSWLAHGPSYPIKPIDANAESILDANASFDHPGTTSMPPAGGRTTRGYLQEIAGTWNAGNGTPIVDALFEAAKYMRGEDIHWGNKPPSEPQAAHPSTYGANTNSIANGSISNTYQCNTEACGGNTGVACNGLKTCTTTPASTTTNTCNTPSCGDSCTKTSTASLVCGAGMTFCGTATDATECTVAVNPPIDHACALLTEAECLTANPTWTSCTTDATTSVISCQESIEDTVTCPVDEYTCTTTTPEIETCTHEICGTISTSGINYISPITMECQSNAIILLSDGEPTVNNSSPLVETMVGSTLSNNCSNDTSDMGRCGKELAEYLSGTDHSSLDGEQNISLYTIGFALGAASDAENYLRTLASSGGGTFAGADSSADLIKAFKEAISGVNKKSRSFRSPTYTANHESILSHGKYVYLPVFNRESGPRWSGNLKKFKVEGGRLLDKDDSTNVATSDSGSLSTVKDEWATTDIDHAVKDGGAAGKLNPDTRVLFTDNGNIGTSASLITLNASNVSLGQLGLSNNASSSEKTELINFIKGKNIDGTNRHHMGDIVHSKPVYIKINGQGYIFVGTNEGYLHAFKEDGTEVFAYMPHELLKNIKRQKENDPTDDHIYGVDGEITVWEGPNNQILLLFGLRRGGKAYYALDVSTPSSPSLAWKITDSNVSGLGYSWSKPKVAKVKTAPNEDPKNVMIIGGGYVDDNGLEPNHKDGNGDPVTEADNSGTGADVFIIDIADGSVLWKASQFNSSIQYAVAGGVRTLDLDRNGLVDRLYFADVGGNIWRADLDSSNDITSSETKVYHFASLGGSSSPTRKFFNEPDVAFFRHAGQYVISVAIGSGDRPNALSTSTDDRFFVLFDNHPFKYSTNETVETTTDADSHLVAAPVADSENLIKLNRTKRGWYLDFDKHTGTAGVAGEKVLSSAFTYENKVIFTSFGIGTPVVDPDNSCNTSSENQSHLYALDLLKGKKTINLDEPEGIDLFVGPIDDIPDSPGVYIDRPDNCSKHDCSFKSYISSGTAPPVEAQRVSNQLPRVYWIDKKRN